MSGFEVVGVVLGSIPLLISGLEHYADGIELIGDMWAYEAVVADLVCNFDVATARFRLTCEKLLAPLALPEKQLLDLLDDPESKAWEEDALANDLRKRLGTSYRPYSSSVVRLSKRIKKFAEKLGLDEKNGLQPSWIDKNGKTQQKLVQKFFQKSNHSWKRIKLALDHNKFGKLIQEIDRDIEQIEKLVEGNLELGAIRQKQKRSANSKHWLEIRNRARKLFEAISSRWACSCPIHHNASLRLEALDDKDSNDPETFCFNVLFYFDEDSNSTSLPWNWRDVVFTQFNTETSESSLSKPIAQRMVSFGTEITETTDLMDISKKFKVPSSAMVLEDLCKALCQVSNDADCLGVLRNHQWQHYIYPAPSWKLSPGGYKLTTIEQILTQPGGNGIGTKDKYRLAYLLASAVLQFHSTPWITETWDLNDIQFFTNSLTTSIHPYLSKSFATSPSSPSAPRSQTRSWVQNEMIFALGINLLELSFGRKLSTFHTPADLNEGKETMFTEFSVANRLSREIDSREVPRYTDAVNRCVRCNFDTTSVDLDDVGFQNLFWENVVLPLKECYEFTIR